MTKGKVIEFPSRKQPKKTLLEQLAETKQEIESYDDLCKLSLALNITTEDALRVATDFYETYPKLVDWIGQVRATCQEA